MSQMSALSPVLLQHSNGWMLLQSLFKVSLETWNPDSLGKHNSHVFKPQITFAINIKLSVSTLITNIVSQLHYRYLDMYNTWLSNSLYLVENTEMILYLHELTATFAIKSIVSTPTYMERDRCKFKKKKTTCQYYVFIWSCCTLSE